LGLSYCWFFEFCILAIINNRDRLDNTFRTQITVCLAATALFGLSPTKFMKYPG
jgi:hypothetical protein